MTLIDNISVRLQNVLKDLEKVTGDIEVIQTQVRSVANDDFLTRDIHKPMDL